MTGLMKTALAAILALGISAAAVAGPYEDAGSAYQKGDYATALKLWRELAEKGDVLAQIRVGALYADGEGVTRDYAEAVNWFRRAAEQGNARAQFNLATLYDNGQGVPQSYA